MIDRLSRDSIRNLALLASVLLMPGCGGASKLEFHTNEPGNFRVLAAGTPTQSNQNIASPAGQLSVTSVESIDSDQIRRLVVYTDLPASIVQSSNPGALLEGGIRGIRGKPEWTIERLGETTLDSHPGREVHFAVNSASLPEKGSGAARIFLVGNRLYQAIIVGPASKLTEEELEHFVKSFELLRQVPPVATAARSTADAPVTPPTVATHAGMSTNPSAFIPQQAPTPVPPTPAEVAASAPSTTPPPREAPVAQPPPAGPRPQATIVLSRMVIRDQTPRNQPRSPSRQSSRPAP